jgi:hypothetical protein
VLIAAAVYEGERAYPAAFALLAVLAFCHYDRVYRPKHLGVAFPARLDAVARAWPAHLVIAGALAAGGVVTEGFFALAALLAAALAAQALAARSRAPRPARP